MVKLLQVRSQNKSSSKQFRANGDDCLKIEIIFLEDSFDTVFKGRLEEASMQVIPYLDRGLNERANLPVVYSEAFFTYLSRLNKLEGTKECLKSNLDILDKFKYSVSVVRGKKIVYKYQNYIIYNQITKAAIKSLGDLDSERFVSILDTIDIWVD